MPRTRRVSAIVALIALLILGVGFYRYGRTYWVPAYQRLVGKRTVDDVLREFGPGARSTWNARLQRFAMEYPPGELTLIALKRERRLEVWTTSDGHQRLIAQYPILAASGNLGPKLREGDLQVPEGLYRIEGLNPNSAFHLSMKINYPNEFDRKQALKEERVQLGGDIFIHGKTASIGCLAMGDPAIEELFVLVADVGVANTQVLIAPYDFRTTTELDPGVAPAWVSDLYKTIADALVRYK